MCCDDACPSRLVFRLSRGVTDVQYASAKKYQEILEEAFVRSLNVEGELYIGIPDAVESRVATVTIDASDLSMLDPKLQNGIAGLASASLPSSCTFSMIGSLIQLANTLNVRRAIIPGANGHFSARAVARFYAALVDGGVVPPHHSKSHDVHAKIFTSRKEKVHDAFLGSGDYKDMILPNGKFGLRFKRVSTTDDSVIGFGHAGLGGSTAYCDIKNRFVICVTLNKLSIGALTGEMIRFVCSELDLPVREEYEGSTEFIEKPVIN